ncbi:hypothetical protein EXIGLDRAFT_716448 [Exidia glandulosa HHB12029]|uniref:C2H2-type domain-containing protein n=1 Tax=Exidia glandulosa HHB12029 TaxID=1314781 RepID=A0A165P8K8_EXIGL|nr:hypothetical protein EXIGLDRAFT_716448 [Exidia glandulosa HHB12029]
MSYHSQYMGSTAFADHDGASATARDGFDSQPVGDDNPGNIDGVHSRCRFVLRPARWRIDELDAIGELEDFDSAVLSASDALFSSPRSGNSGSHALPIDYPIEVPPATHEGESDACIVASRSLSLSNVANSAPGPSMFWASTKEAACQTDAVATTHEAFTILTDQPLSPRALSPTVSASQKLYAGPRASRSLTEHRAGDCTSFDSHLHGDHGSSEDKTEAPLSTKEREKQLHGNVLRNTPSSQRPRHVASRQAGRGLIPLGRVSCTYLSPVTGERCTEHFSDKGGATRHLRNKHGREERRAVKRGALALTDASLIREVKRTITSNDLGKRGSGVDGFGLYVCRVCAREYCRRDALVRHMRVVGHEVLES